MSIGRGSPWHLWTITVVSLVWNGIGVWNWYLQVTHSPAYWNALTVREAAYLQAAPLWTDVAFGVAVWCGLLGALMLLFRRRLAFNAFVAGLVAAAADTVYVHLLSNGREVMGAMGASLGFIVIAVFVIQSAYAHWARRKGVIR